MIQKTPSEWFVEFSEIVASTFVDPIAKELALFEDTINVVAYIALQVFYLFCACFAAVLLVATLLGG